MKFLYIKLIGYKAIYAGMNIDSFSLDLTKMRFPITLIQGRNGIGKSTVLHALSLEVDPPSIYLENLNGGKELILQNNDIIYKIIIESKINSKLERLPTRVFIEKNGIQLNPSGNVTSYYDIIFSEFELDPNYMALTMLSITNRGLAEKKPSERKKILGNIIGSLETYNNINKVLVKKSGFYKSSINNITNKITMIGDEHILRTSLANLKLQIDSLNTKKIQISKQIAILESRIKSLDPDNTIQNIYQSILSELKNINNLIDVQDKNISILYKKYKINTSSNIKEEIISLENNINKLTQNLNNNKDKLELLLNQQNEDINTIMLKQNKLDNLKLDDEYNNISNMISFYEKNISEQESIINTLKLQKFSISKDELLSIFKIVQQIKEYIFVIKDTSDSDILKNSIEYILQSDISISSELSNIKYSIDIKEAELDNFKEKEKSYIDASDLLKSRPSSCMDDTCIFIKNAINEVSNFSYDKIHELEYDINELKIRYAYLNSINTIVTYLTNLINFINSNKYLLSITHITHIFVNTDIFLNKLLSGYEFNELEDVDKFIQYADIIDNYHENKETLLKLYGDIKVYNERIVIIDEISSELETLQHNLNNLIKNIEENRNSIIFTENIIKDNLFKLDIYNKLLIEIEKKNNLLEHKDEIRKKYESIKKDILSVQDNIDELNKLNIDLSNLENQLKPLDDEKDKLQYSLTLLSSYTLEISEFKEKYNIIEKLKKYSSPTTGIQTIFMQMYMNKTYQMTNELLSLLFNGQLRIEQYIINEKEFRIPCIGGSGLIIDDISSCSTSQVCMISMILSLSLLSQASTSYNIIRLDEIDDGLDTTNRIEFINVLYKLVQILGIEQLFIVSHNNEFDTQMVNILQLE